MEQWRERGYVPDSDEDDDFDSQELVGEGSEAAAFVDDDTIVRDHLVEVRTGTNGEKLEAEEGHRKGEECFPNGSSPCTRKDYNEPETDPLTDDHDTLLQSFLNKDEASKQPAKAEALVNDVGPQIELPSSPDELQFEEFRKQPPRTPLAAPSRHDDDLFGDSANSSPLSSIPPLLKSPPSRVPSPALMRETDETLPQLQQRHEVSDHGDIVIEDAIDAPDDELYEWKNQRFGRTLRQRNAIQLHPYMLENAQYRSLLKKRGVQPVRMPVEEPRPQDTMGESQSFDYQDENDPPSSSPALNLSPVNRDHGDFSQSLSDQNKAKSQDDSWNDYRNVNTNINSATHNVMGSKRRKICHVQNSWQTGPSTKEDQAKRIQVVINHSPEKRQQLRELYDVFDVPPSPPSSGEPSSNTPKASASFKFPPGSPRCRTKTQLQTPLSEKQTQPESHFPNVTSPELPPIPDSDGFDILSATHEVTEESPSESLEEDSLEIRRIQRQIKGVLPASFARLDRQKHEEYKRQVAEKERRKTLVRERRTGKGVAQPVLRKEGLGNQAAIPTQPRNFDFLSDSDPDDDVISIISRPQEEQERLERFFGLVVDDDDIPEDNRIDYMAPPVSRRPKNKRHWDQNRIGSWTSLHPKPQRKRQTRITDKLNIQRKPKSAKSRPLNLGILDAEDIQGQHTHRQPQFLRVAARLARSRQDKGRRSPTQKILRMATKTDTRDANASLINWRIGKYQPASAAAPSRTRTSPKSQQGAGIVSISPKRRRTITDLENNLEPEPIFISDDDASTEQPALSDSKKMKPTVKQAWVINRPYGISSFQRQAPRPAQLEILPGLPSPSAFNRTLSALHKAYRLSKQRETMTRFLGQKDNQLSPRLENNVNPTQSDSNGHPAHKKEVKSRRPIRKKRQPQHINIETFEYRQPLGFDDGVGVSNFVSDIEKINHLPLAGLLPQGRPYKLDFDTHPLYSETFYHQSTFIGSGKFSRALDIQSRDLDIDNGYTTIKLRDRLCHWGPWSETVSSELGELFQSMGIQSTLKQTLSNMAPLNGLETAQALGMYESIICYVTDHLTFRDPVDRINFISTCTGFVSQLRYTFESSLEAETSINKFVIGIETFNLVFLNQLLQIASHECVNSSKASLVAELIKLSAQQTTDLALSRASVLDIQQFLEDNRRLEKRESGIRDGHPFVNAIVVTQIILKQKAVKDSGIEVRVLDQVNSFSYTNVQDLERAWEALFVSLAFEEMDQFGIVHPRQRFQLHHDQWPRIKRLIKIVLESYKLSPKQQWAPLNHYLRTLLHRCFILIEVWGWRQCKPILETLFDFFTGNSLHDLEKEPVHGSPRFLDDLASKPVIEIDSSDSCFRMFLKIIAIGFKYLNTLHEPKRILNLVWRLLPNHGRTYPKEKPLLVEDLNALRNHHDLLCALYCCAPKGCRPNLNTILHLVHPPTSHKEACSINIHSWSRLVRFTLANDRYDLADLGKFAEWHGEFIIEILKQHYQARSEIEAEDPSASFFPRQYIESAIAKNQRHAEGLISDALFCMKTAINSAKDLDQAAALMEKMPIGKLFELFNPKVKRLDSVIGQTLDVLMAFIKLDSQSALSITEEAEGEVHSSTANGDSQDDWLDLCKDQVDVSSPGSLYLNHAISPAIARFTSICFSVEQTPSDCILTKTLDCWLSVAYTRVKHGLRQWSSYFNRYDQDSWPALKLTDQTRKFMPYFLSRLIAMDSTSYMQCQSQILTYWSAALVERELYLKYQHDFTNALMNEDRENPLFKDLPFAMNRTTGRYEITLTEFCQRRISLISSLLSSMRVHISELSPSQIHAPQGPGEIYQEMIRSIMATMRHNSEEVGKSAIPGSYVEFVQRVVEFLQVHSEDICPIDKYFTDPASFPLPTSDPNYVVAKLKRYGGRLAAGSKFSKQLVTFIQGVSERAAVDVQQEYLAGQLYEAMSSKMSEKADYQQPSLCCFLLQCVIPEYMIASLNHPAAWILARPLIQATTRVFANLMLRFDSFQQEEVNITIDSITAYFKAVHCVLQHPVDDTFLLSEPPVLLILTSIFESIIASLGMVDYLDRLGQEVDNILLYIKFFAQTALYNLSSLLDPPAVAPRSPLNPTGQKHPPTFFVESRDFAARELKSWLESNWTFHEGKYFVRRGQQYTEIDVTTSMLSVEVAQTAFIKTIQLLFGSLEALDLM